VLLALSDYAVRIPKLFGDRVINASPLYMTKNSYTPGIEKIVPRNVI